MKNGVTLLDEQNNEMGISKKAAAVGITAVVASRIIMATPGMGNKSFSLFSLENNKFLIFLPK